MAEGSDLTGVIKRLTEANGRLYRGWVELSLEYLRSITELLDPEAGTPGDRVAEPETESAGSAVVLEAVGGETATGAFLLTNDLGRTLTCEPVASAFVGPDGETARPKVGFDPGSLQLKPGEQRVVRVRLDVGKRLPAGVAYTGTIGIKGMKGFEVAAVLRRREDAEASPIDRAVESEGAAPKGGARSKAAKKKARSRAKKKKGKQ